MPTNPETKRRLRAVRRLAVSYPDRTAEERLTKIVGIASGETEPTTGRAPSSPDLLDRIAAGQKSRARGNAHDHIERRAEEDKETARKKRGTRNRQETSGRDRSQA